MNYKSLAELADVHYGSSPFGCRTNFSTIPMYGTSGVVGFSNKPLFNRAGVIIPRKGSLGKPWYAADPFWAIDTTYAAIPKTGVDTKWLFYQLLAFDLTKLNEATGVPSISRDWLLKQRFYSPDYSEQRGVAEVLSTMDEQIEATEATVHKLNMQRKGLAADLLTCRHLPTSEIADVRLSEVIPTVQYGISSSLTEAGAIPVLRMNNLSGGEIDVSDLKYSPTDVPSDLYLKPGDVLFNRTNSMEHVGRTSLWRGQLTECTFASYLVRLSPDSRRLLPEYLVYLLEWEENQLQMRKYATPGVQQVNINPTSLRRCRVQIPKSLDAQRETVAALDAARENIEALREEVAKLKLQKQGLMRDLLTGAVRVTGGH